jgi:putative acetyltransferase
VTDPATARLASAVAPVLHTGQRLRTVTDADGPALVALVGAAYDEYACGPLDPDGFDADLAAPARSAATTGRSWWVVTDTDRVVASVAHGPLHASPPVVELHRLYLAPEVRGIGLASALITAIAEEARLGGAGALEAWSDTRLVDAHTRYLRLGFALTGAQRDLHDPAGTTELHFSLPL